jgi:para-aminobenzoate synthetase/4-amino-4-deoxychorismate lyase
VTVPERTWAAFDIPAQPPHRERRLRGRFRRPPAAVLRAAAPAEVPGVVAAAEAAALAGSWVVGGLSYAASGAWDPAQRARADDAPAAHFEVYPDPPEPWPDGPSPLPALDWRPDALLAGGLSATAAIGRVLEHIGAGDCYQVNLTTRWRTAAPGLDLFDHFAALASAQSGGYAVFSASAGVASVSPELFFSRHADGLVTQPMKGTAAAGADPAVLASPKERAENLMIVDLLRNDLGRVCRTGTVSVDRLFELHRLPTVWQLTSTVSGRLPAATPLAEVFAALFPCASVTGAPKLAAMGVIAELEASPRRWYCGALGVIRPGGDATFNVPIRTVERLGDQLVCGIGSGIVADSDPAAEVAEWHAKSAFLGGTPLRALETMLLVDGAIVRRAAHLARLARTCAAHGLDLSPATVEHLLDEVCAARPAGRHRVRLVAGGGPPSVEVGPAPEPGTPLRLRLAAVPLDADDLLGPVIRHKTTHRAHYDRLRAAAGPGVDDVLCHNSGGELTECTFGNIAVLLDGEWLTPPEESGLLPGTLRAELLAHDRLHERRLTVTDLARAEAVAFVNGLRGWCPASLV